MRVIVTGGTGLIGTELVRQLHTHGHEVFVLSRNPENKVGQFPPEIKLIQWDAKTHAGWDHLITTDTAIVNLAGENIAHFNRFTTQNHIKLVRQSRLDATHAVFTAIEAAAAKPRVLLQGSAVGYYGFRGQESLGESSPPGAGWRAEVTQTWEATSAPVEALGVRRCLLRIGVVLDRRKGILPPMVLATRLMGDQIGGGRQWVSWVHNQDVGAAIIHLMQDETTSGPYNLTAPYPVTNLTLMHTIGQVKHWPTFIPVPGAALKLVLGDVAATVLDSQRVYPPRLLESGYTFHYPQIENALRNLL